MTNRFYISTPIYYVNDRPHIGHVYTTLVADVVARHRRQRGDEVFFLTGTDEHAPKVAESAREHGVEPSTWADRHAAAFEQTFSAFGISNDDFIRTTQPRHKERVRSTWARSSRAATSTRTSTTAGTTPARRSTSRSRGPPGSTTARRSAAGRWCGARRRTTSSA